MTAIRTVFMCCVMAVGYRITAIRVFLTDLQYMLINVIAMRMVKMTIVQIINMITVSDCRLPYDRSLSRTGEGGFRDVFHCMKTSFSSSDWTWMCKIVPESFCSPANENCPECTNKYSLFYGDDKKHDGRCSTGSPEMQMDIREL